MEKPVESYPGKRKNNKSQITSLKQIPMTEIPKYWKNQNDTRTRMFWSLNTVICDLFVIWCLLFGISRLNQLIFFKDNLFVDRLLYPGS